MHCYAVHLKGRITLAIEGDNQITLQEQPVKGQVPGIRVYHSFIGFILKIFGFAKTVKVDGIVWYVNRKSFEKWKSRESLIVDGIKKPLEFISDDISAVIRRAVQGDRPMTKNINEVDQPQFSFEQKLSIPPSQIVDALSTGYSFTPNEIISAAKNFSLQIGSITNQSKGVIQDPAGSAIGVPSSPANCSAGGLSGAIYKKFTELAPIPDIAVGKSCLNPGFPRIVHTHSPELFNPDYKSGKKGLKDAIQELSEAYYEAIHSFIQGESDHHQDTLHLCAISASIYGGHFIAGGPGGNHIDPSLTISAVIIALANYEKNNPGVLKGFHINLFYLPNNQNLTEVARNVKQACEG